MDDKEIDDEIAAVLHNLATLLQQRTGCHWGGLPVSGQRLLDSFDDQDIGKYIAETLIAAMQHDWPEHLAHAGLCLADLRNIAGVATCRFLSKQLTILEGGERHYGSELVTQDQKLEAYRRYNIKLINDEEEK